MTEVALWEKRAKLIPLSTWETPRGDVSPEETLKDCLVSAAIWDDDSSSSITRSCARRQVTLSVERWRVRIVTFLLENSKSELWWFGSRFSIGSEERYNWLTPWEWSRWRHYYQRRRRSGAKGGNWKKHGNNRKVRRASVLFDSMIRSEIVLATWKWDYFKCCDGTLGETREFREWRRAVHWGDWLSRERKARVMCCVCIHLNSLFYFLSGVLSFSLKISFGIWEIVITDTSPLVSNFQ